MLSGGYLGVIGAKIFAWGFLGLVLGPGLAVAWLCCFGSASGCAIILAKLVAGVLPLLCFCCGPAVFEGFRPWPCCGFSPGKDPFLQLLWPSIVAALAPLRPRVSDQLIGTHPGQ